MLDILSWVPLAMLMTFYCWPLLGAHWTECYVSQMSLLLKETLNLIQPSVNIYFHGQKKNLIVLYSMELQIKSSKQEKHLGKQNNY